MTNLAVVEKAQAEFGTGLNVLTGETGAGKSVLMGALELVLGARADTSVVREGAREARVEAVFDLSDGVIHSKVLSVLGEAGIELEGGELVVRRSVGAAGGTRAWVNDQSATTAMLRRLGALLVDIHGPRANQNILEERYQRSALDSFGQIDASKYAASWEAYGRVTEALAALSEAGAADEEKELLRYQVSELDEAGITQDDNDLAERHAAAAHAIDIIAAANAVTDSLGGDQSVASLLRVVRDRLSSIRRFFPQAESWEAQIDEIAVSADELSRSVADAASRLEGDEGELEQLDKRLSMMNRLLRKYHAADASGLVEIQEAKRTRLAELEGREGRMAELREEQAAAKAALLEAGAAMRKARAKAAERLAKAVTKELRGLGFLKARFDVAVREAEPTASGCDSVEYIFEPNPGESARPLALVASSGEAARVMLALKTVLSAHDGNDLLVFDEIDANIGGETGRAVGQRLREVAKNHQVIAITHLPQSAVYADRHLVASKAVSGGRTRTTITPVAGQERIDEIARMLGGGAAALAHAKDLIESVAQVAQN